MRIERLLTLVIVIGVILSAQSPSPPARKANLPKPGTEKSNPPEAESRGRGQWFVESIEGDWEVAEGGAAGHKTARHLDPKDVKYEVLSTSDDIMCTKGPCAIKCSVWNGKTVDTVDLFDKDRFPRPPRTQTWMAVPSELNPPAAPTVALLNSIVSSKMDQGGGKKGVAACGGDFALTAPRCEETLDTEEFHLSWPVTDDVKDASLTLFLGDSTAPNKVRKNRIPGKDGEFNDPDGSVRAYLHSLQADTPDSRPVLSIRLAQTSKTEANRVVSVLSGAEEKVFRQSMHDLDQAPGLLGDLMRLDLLLRKGMWTKAGELSARLRQNAPDNATVMEYALAGLCLSGKPADVAELRRKLTEKGLDPGCAPEGQGH